MGTIGNLYINVKANTTGLVKGIKKSKKSLGGFKGALAGIGVAVAAAFALKAIEAFAGAISDAMGRIDEVAKFSKSIGVATEAVQVFRHAATLTGVSVGEADKAFGKMVKNIGEATMGIGTATDAFKVLGLDTQKLSNMKADEMFGVIADSIMEVDNRAQQASLAYDIFGRAGMKLLNTMELGAEGIEKMRDEMEGMGVLFSSLDAEGVERANDAMATLGMVMDSIFQRLAIDLAPMIEETANKLTEMASNPEFVDGIKALGEVLVWLVEIAGGFAKMWKGAVDGTTEIFAGFLLFFEGDFSLGILKTLQGIGNFFLDVFPVGWVIDYFFGAEEQIEAVGNAADVAAAKTRNLAEEAAAKKAAIELQKEMETLNKLVDEFASKDRMFAINKELDSLSEKYYKIEDALKAGNIEIKTGRTALNEILRLWDELDAEKNTILNPESVEIIDEAQKKLEEMGKTLTENMRTPAEVFADKMKEINELLEAGAISMETYTRAVADLESNLPQEEIEIAIVTKGIVEGLSTALGTIKIAGEVSKQEQLAQQSVKTQEEMNKQLGMIDDAITSIGDSTITTEVAGLKDHVANAVANAVIKVQEMDAQNQLLETANQIAGKQFTELENINKNLKEMKTGSALT